MKIRNGIVTWVASFALSASVAAAASISLEDVSGSNYQSVFDSFLSGATRTVENFDGAATRGGTGQANAAAIARTQGDVFASSVGTFEGLGSTGTGSSITNQGQNIQIRSGNNYGRFNVLDNPTAASSALSANFLDSNDTLGFSWSIVNTANDSVRGVSAFLTDLNDAGQQLTLDLLIDGDLADTLSIGGRVADAAVFHLTAEFGTGWNTATLEFRKSGINDGFGLSNAALHAGANPSVIPLPAAGVMLLGGLGLLGGVGAIRRRREATKA